MTKPLVGRGLFVLLPLPAFLGREEDPTGCGDGERRLPVPSAAAAGWESPSSPRGAHGQSHSCCCGLSGGRAVAVVQRWMGPSTQTLHRRKMVLVPPQMYAGGNFIES